MKLITSIWNAQQDMRGKSARGTFPTTRSRVPSATDQSWQQAPLRAASGGFRKLQSIADQIAPRAQGQSVGKGGKPQLFLSGQVILPAAFQNLPIPGNLGGSNHSITVAQLKKAVVAAAQKRFMSLNAKQQSTAVRWAKAQVKILQTQHADKKVIKAEKQVVKALKTAGQILHNTPGIKGKTVGAKLQTIRAAVKKQNYLRAVYSQSANMGNAGHH